MVFDSVLIFARSLKELGKSRKAGLTFSPAFSLCSFIRCLLTSQAGICLGMLAVNTRANLTPYSTFEWQFPQEKWALSFFVGLTTKLGGIFFFNSASSSVVRTAHEQSGRRPLLHASAASCAMLADISACMNAASRVSENTKKQRHQVKEKVTFREGRRSLVKKKIGEARNRVSYRSFDRRLEFLAATWATPYFGFENRLPEGSRQYSHHRFLVLCVYLTACSVDEKRRKLLPPVPTQHGAIIKLFFSVKPQYQRCLLNRACSSCFDQARSAPGIYQLSISC